MTISESARRIVNNLSHAQLDKLSSELDTDANVTLDLVTFAPAIGQLADFITTKKALNLGYEEGNPFIKSIVRNTALFGAIKLGVSAGMAYSVHKLEQAGHKNLSKVVSGIGFLVGAGPAISNVLTMRKK